jgi:hypothetical protein
MKIKIIFYLVIFLMNQLAYSAAPAAVAWAEPVNPKDNQFSQKSEFTNINLPQFSKNPFITPRTLNLIIINDAYEQSLFKNLENPWNYNFNAVETEELAKSQTN